MDKNKEIQYLKELGADNRDAFNELFRHYYPKLRIFLVSMLKNEEDAKDIAQNIFVKIWTNRKSISEVRFFSYYIFNMAKNAIYDHYDHNLVKENYVKKNN